MVSVERNFQASLGANLLSVKSLEKISSFK